MAAQSSPQIPFPDLPEGTVTFLFTDIEGSTKLLHRLRERYATLLADQRQILREAFTNWDGKEVDTQGDAFFVAFSRATQAVSAAAESQRRLAEHAWPEGVVVRVRMGIHTGEPWSGQEGYVGMDVHRAARIAHVGHGGQVLLSETTTALVQDELPAGVSLADLGRHLLKDIRRPERISQLVIQGLPSDFPPLTSLEALPPESSRLPRQVGKCPYRGLSAFQEQDATFYFGREAFIDKLEQAVRTKRVVAVIVGSSGSGKSSALFAGLLPRLRKTGGFQFATFRPGNQPFQALAGALLPLLGESLSETDRLAETRKLAERMTKGEISLADIAGRILEKAPQTRQVLLVADQFEELYTLCPDVSQQKAFIDTLLSGVSDAAARREAPLIFLVTLRADFMGQALAHRPFADALQQASLLMGPMTRQELHTAIEKPAEMQGAAFEPGLVERIQDDVGEKPGTLPLLEFTLTMLWEQQTDGWLTHANYEALGGVEGALATHADQVYAGLDPDDQELARRALVQLVQPGEGTEDTRRIATRQELGEAGWQVVQRLADRRLVVTGRDAIGNETAEVIHEALIQKWGRFQEWMESDRLFRSWQERLRGNLRQWHDSGQDEGALLAGAPLESAQNWLAERAGQVSPQELQYIEASSALQTRQLKERQLRRQRTILGLAAGLVVALVLMTVAVIFARQSNQNAQHAMARELAAASVNNLEVDPQRSILLAMQAVKTVDLPEAEAALHQAIRASRLRDSFSAHTSSLYGIAYSPNGSHFATASTDGTVQVWGLDQDGNKINQTSLISIPNPVDYDPTSDAVGYTIAFSPDGTRLAAVSEKHTARIWDTSSGKLLNTLEGHAGDVYSVTFSPDGKLVATTSADLTVKLWDAASGKDLQTLSGHTDLPSMAVFSPDGKTLASGSNDATVMIWKAVEPPAGRELYRLSYTIQENDWVCSLAFSPDGERLATGACSQIRLYDIASASPDSPPKLLLNISAHDNAINSLYFNVNGDRLISGSADGKAKVWDAATGQELFSLNGNAGWITSISLSPDGQRLLTAHGSGTVNLWDLSISGNQEWFTAGGGEAPKRGCFSPDGKRLVSTTWNQNAASVIFWDVSTSGIQEERSMELDHGARISATAISSDLTRLATVGIDMDTGEPSAKIWDLATGQIQAAFSMLQTATKTGHSMVIYGVNFSPDNKMLATGSDDGTAIIWDLSTGKAVQTLTGHTGKIRDLVFGPNGTRLATASYDGTARIWDPNSGKSLLELKGHTNPLESIAYSQDGKSLLTGSDDNTAKLWDVQTGLEILTLTGHTSSIFSVAFSADGRYFATGSIDGTAKLWDAATDQEVFTVPGFRVGFSPDSRHLVTYDVFGIIRGFYLDVSDLMQAARRRLIRSWTPEECSKFLHADTCPPTP